MIQIKAKEARANWNELLDKVEQGENIVTLRRSKKILRLPSLQQFRKSIRRKGKALSQTVMDLRKK